METESPDLLCQDLSFVALSTGLNVQAIASRRFFKSCGYEHRATLFAEFYSERFGEIDDCVYYKRLA